MPCLQSVGISSCLPVWCPSISFSVCLCSFSQKPLVLAISHRCGCVIASSNGQPTLVSCFLGKFQQVLRPPPSWCLHFWCDLTWSSLLLISTSSFQLNLVCSRLSYLRPNTLNRIAGMIIIVLKTLSFNFTGIFLSHITRILPSTSSTRFLSYC